MAMTAYDLWTLCDADPINVRDSLSGRYEREIEHTRILLHAATNEALTGERKMRCIGTVNYDRSGPRVRYVLHHTGKSYATCLRAATAALMGALAPHNLTPAELRARLRK